MTHFPRTFETCSQVRNDVRNTSGPLVLHELPPWRKSLRKSFVMHLFERFTVWCSLLVLKMSYAAAAVAHKSWSSWLWRHNPSPPSSFWRTLCRTIRSQRGASKLTKTQTGPGKSSLYSISCGVCGKSFTNYLEVNDVITWGERFFVPNFQTLSTPISQFSLYSSHFDRDVPRLGSPKQICLRLLRLTTYRRKV